MIFNLIIRFVLAPSGMSFYNSSKSVKTIDEIKWVDDESRADSADLDRDDSISSENEGSASDTDGRRALRAKNSYIWEEDTVLLSLQGLYGFEDLIEKIRNENVAEILDNQHALTSGVLISAHMCKANVLKNLLQEGGSVSTTDSSGRTALHLAANSNCLDCVKILLEHGANVNQKDICNKITPLHCAASRGGVHCVKYLLKSGADVNACYNKKTALHFAVENLATDCVRELLEAGAIPNTLQVFSETPLHVAASLGSTEIIKLLIKHGSSVNVQCGHEKLTALHLAAEDGNSEAVRILIEAGAAINAINHKKQTPLHIASLCQATESIEFLLKHGANPNASDSDGRTPLHGAIVKVSRNCECVKLLLNYGAKVNKPDAFGYTPLHLAALNEFSNCVSLMINYGGDVTARTNGGVSVLTFITRRTPDVIPKYVAKFDNSIKLTDHEIGDVDCELKLDFRILVPSSTKGETELLLNFIEVGHREILKHPLCETFLFLKWRRIRKYFLFSLFYHFLYVLLFTSYVAGVFMLNCGCVSRTRTLLREICQVSPYVNSISYCLITLNLLMMAKELFQIAHSWYNYIKHWENWLQWMIILSVFFCVVPISDDIRKIIRCWQHHVAAIGIFLTWVELMMIVGRFPIFGLYIQMFTTVAYNFVKFLLAYLCLLIAFSLSFNVLFPYHPPFNTMYIGLIKTIIMMSGELEFEDIFYNNSPVMYPVTAQIMFLAFVVLVTVILTNLMVGLAVSDIQGLQQSAGLDRLVRQAELVAHLESMLFSRLLKWVPPRLLAFFYRHALLLKSEHHCALYIRPNDPREERIPKDLIKNIYDLIAEKKERFKKKRKSARRCAYSRDNIPRVNSINDYVYSGRPHASYFNHKEYKFSIK